MSGRRTFLAGFGLASVLAGGLAPGVAPAQDTLPVRLGPDDPALYYVGRFDRSDPAGPRCQWSASTVSVRFDGTDLQAAVKDEGDNSFEVVVDGKAGPAVHPGKGEHVLDLARGLPAGEHTARLFKRTEANRGTVQFTGFYLNAGGRPLPPQRLTRRIAVIGDSISCGYGNEGKTTLDKGYEFENAWMAYGAIAARALNAEYVCTAWSGRKLSNIDTIYGATLPTDPASHWDFSAWQPDAVLINLATNDFSSKDKDPDEAQWTGLYKDFLRRVRRDNPKAMIYIASGSMMNDSWPPGHHVLTLLKKYLQRVEDDLRAEGETRLRQIHFAPQRIKPDGVGGGTHPNVVTHQKMAAQWVAVLEKDLGWTPADANAH